MTRYSAALTHFTCSWIVRLYGTEARAWIDTPQADAILSGKVTPLPKVPVVIVPELFITILSVPDGFCTLKLALVPDGFMIRSLIMFVLQN